MEEKPSEGLHFIRPSPKRCCLKSPFSWFRLINISMRYQRKSCKTSPGTDSREDESGDRAILKN